MTDMTQTSLRTQARALAEYAKSLVSGDRRSRRLKMYASLHSFAQIIIVPWGFTRQRFRFLTEVHQIVKPVRRRRTVSFCDCATDPPPLDREKARDAMVRANGHGRYYEVDTAFDAFGKFKYGSSDDWVCKELGVNVSIIVELRPETEGSFFFFWPSVAIWHIMYCTFTRVELMTAWKFAISQLCLTLH